MTLDELRSLLMTVSPVVAVSLAVVLVAWTVAARKWNWSSAPEAYSTVTTLLLAGLLLALSTAALASIVELRPWASATAWTATACFLVARLNRAGYQAQHTSGVPTVHIPPNINQPSEPIKLLADAGRPIVTPHPYSVDTYNRSTLIRLSGFITTESSDSFVKECRSIKPGSIVTVEVSCYGGESNAARSMHAALRFLDARNTVYVLVTGDCSSSAVSVIMAIPPERRFAAVKAMFMIHTASGGGRSGITHVNANFVLEPIISGTRIDPASLELLLDSWIDHFITADEALELGLVSRIM